MRLIAITAAALALSSLSAFSARADEGMWTFDNFPLQQANAALGTRLDQAWLDRVRMGSVRISGCSASFVSPEGLILTNQHCIRTCIQANASPGQDLLAEGVFARTREAELRCPGQSAEVLLEIQDVTARIGEATRGLSGGEFARAREATFAAIEQEACAGRASERCQVISFYQGGEFKLYRYYRYTDVRLVFAPEHQAVIFGGDPDNFNFPRYALDAAFLRAYEDGVPAMTPHFLRWNPQRLRDGQPVFVSGNPGSTSRLHTIAQLRAERDWTLPYQIKRFAELRGRMIIFAAQSDENARVTRDVLRGVENNLKRFYGMQRALADRSFWNGLVDAEYAFMAEALARDPSLADAFAEMQAAQDRRPELMDRHDWLESGAGFGSVLYGYARSLVRAGLERERPSGQRLPEYADSRLGALERSVLDARNISNDLEVLYLAFWLNKTREALGTDAPEVQTMLGRESPEALAERLVAGTRLGDPDFRRQLWEGGRVAIEASDDPLIRFVLANDANARTIRQQWQAEVAGPTSRAASRIAEARLAIYGTEGYPDATGSLRLSYGRIAGWSEGGRTVPSMVTVAGLFERATGAPPFNLSPRLLERGDRLERDAVYTVASNNDIIGGNSGSPLLNERGEVVGAVFDGNLPSLGGAYGFDASVNRTVTVTAEIITAALAELYDMPDLVSELTGGH
ncbi:MAG: S46 family peptidase [Brevundimonas sp.]|uniref:S46 family peptidase n=1 Tax=Brevundimonas sp. TaxID=1871086 RepID=UPI003919E059